MLFYIKHKITFVSCLIVFFSVLGGGITWAVIDDKDWVLKSYSNNLSYGGSVKKEANNYFFESRTNPLCLTSSVRCNKALVSYRKYIQPVEGRIVNFEFDLTIYQFNFNNPPDWWVLFQDWLRVDADNRKGNRPISTLEIKSYGKKLYLRHKDSAFQWGTQKNRTKQINNGEVKIELGKSYHVSIKITESTSPNKGGMSVIVDDEIISNAIYQTKSASQWRENVQEFGIYHSKNYDNERNPTNKISMSINNLVRK